MSQYYLCHKLMSSTDFLRTQWVSCRQLAASTLQILTSCGENQVSCLILIIAKRWSVLPQSWRVLQHLYATIVCVIKRSTLDCVWAVIVGTGLKDISCCLRSIPRWSHMQHCKFSFIYKLEHWPLSDNYLIVNLEFFKNFVPFLGYRNL